MSQNQVLTMKRVGDYIIWTNEKDEVVRSVHSPVLDTPPRKKKRFRPSPHTMRGTTPYIKTNELLIRKLPFLRLVREISMEINPDLRFNSEAIQALQVAAEDHMIRTFELTNLLANHGKRTTIMVKDIQLSQRLMGRKYL